MRSYLERERTWNKMREKGNLGNDLLAFKGSDGG